MELSPPETSLNQLIPRQHTDVCTLTYDYFKSRIKVAFGIGTYIANDTDVPALNIVMKVSECNDRPVAKLSNSDGKTMCKDDDYIEYLRKTIEWRLNHK